MNYWIIPDLKSQTRHVKDFKADDFINKVCWHFGITRTSLMGRSRLRVLADARAIIGYVFVKHFNMTTLASANLLKRDHSTIIHYTKKVKKALNRRGRCKRRKVGWTCSRIVGSLPRTLPLPVHLTVKDLNRSAFIRSTQD